MSASNEANKSGQNKTNAVNAVPHMRPQTGEAPPNSSSSNGMQRMQVERNLGHSNESRSTSSSFVRTQQSIGVPAERKLVRHVEYNPNNTHLRHTMISVHGESVPQGAVRRRPERMSVAGTPGREVIPSASSRAQSYRPQPPSGSTYHGEQVHQTRAVEQDRITQGRMLRAMPTKIKSIPRPRNVQIPFNKDWMRFDIDAVIDRCIARFCHSNNMPPFATQWLQCRESIKELDFRLLDTLSILEQGQIVIVHPTDGSSFWLAQCASTFPLKGEVREWDHLPVRWYHFDGRRFHCVNSGNNVSLDSVYGTIGKVPEGDSIYCLCELIERLRSGWLREAYRSLHASLTQSVSFAFQDWLSPETGGMSSRKRAMVENVVLQGSHDIPISHLRPSAPEKQYIPRDPSRSPKRRRINHYGNNFKAPLTLDEKGTIPLRSVISSGSGGQMPRTWQQRGGYRMEGNPKAIRSMETLPQLKAEHGTIFPKSKRRIGEITKTQMDCRNPVGNRQDAVATENGDKPKSGVYNKSSSINVKPELVENQHTGTPQEAAIIGKSDSKLKSNEILNENYETSALKETQKTLRKPLNNGNNTVLKKVKLSIKITNNNR
mmetsp:Transcript_6038/g.9162  ORF Transcript_6038/g.9162 Transcript_6038/m.9162 type:complete len:603 (-) Transcript_6038:639-2447(-)